MRLSLLSAALVAVLSSACDLEPRVTSKAARDTWTQAQPGVREQVTRLRDRQKVLAGRIGTLRVPEGAQDAQLQQLIADLQAALSAVEPAINAAEGTVAQVSADVDSALTRQNKVEARRTVELSLARIQPALAEASAQLDALEPRVGEAEAAMQRGIASVEAEAQRLRRIAFDTAGEGSQADLTDIVFKPGTAELDTAAPTTQPALARLVQFTTACDQLRFTLNGHTGRGDAKAQAQLSKARAEAVAAFLVSQGVAADKIAKVEGLGASKPVVDEPEPGSAAAAGLPPEELAARRARNERVEVVVTTKCPTTPPPAAAAPAAATRTPPAPARAEAEPR